MQQKKLGRPTSENSMKDRIFIRVDNETKIKLDKCKKSLGTTTSDIVRKGIDNVYNDLNTK